MSAAPPEGHAGAVTFFADKFARSCREQQLTAAELADLIVRTRGSEKAKLPWLKLARFGTVKSDGNSLRHDDNVVRITGIEADYDGEKMSFDEAHALLAEAGLQAILYTSPSNTPEKPRWRVLCFLSAEQLPERRGPLLARLNGLLGGIIAPESWTLSQSFYFGAVEGNPSHRVKVLRGDPLDMLEELDASAIGCPEKIQAGRPTLNGCTPEPVSDARIMGRVRSALDAVKNAKEGEKHATLLRQARVLGGLQGLGGYTDETAIAWLMAALPDTVLDWKGAARTARDGLKDGRGSPITLSERPNPYANGNGNAGHEACARRPAPRASPDQTANLQSDPAPPPARAADGKDEKRKRPVNALSLIGFLGNRPEWNGAVRLNLFTETIEVCDPFPPDGNQKPGAMRRLREPDDVLEAMLFFQANGFHKVGKGLVWDVLALAASRAAYHPVRDYLEGLKWDGTARLINLFTVYFNAALPNKEEKEPPEGELSARDQAVAYLERIGRCWAVSAVARIMEPGCKVDHLPVLVGDQGWNKSKGIRALCMDGAWFSDDLPPDLTQRDTKDSLVGKWIVELGEMPHIRKEIERVKAFFSRQSDRYRRAYDRLTNDWPRQSVFIGSTNDLTLIDVTGNRRFWPVEVAGPIDAARIAGDRDQLWAEAVHCYRAGLQWWLDSDIERIAAERQDEFREEDLWSASLSAWIKPRITEAEKVKKAMEPFTLAEAMKGCLGFADANLINRADQNRAAACLKGLGLKSRRQMLDGKRAWRWTKGQAGCHD